MRTMNNTESVDADAIGDSDIIVTANGLKFDRLRNKIRTTYGFIFEDVRGNRVQCASGQPIDRIRRN